VYNLSLQCDLKQKDYRNNSSTLEALQIKIMNVIQNITDEIQYMIQNLARSSTMCLNVRRQLL